MFNNLKCPKLDFFLFRLPKLEIGDYLWFYFSAPPILLGSGEITFTARVEGLNGEDTSHGGQGWDNKTCSII